MDTENGQLDLLEQEDAIEQAYARTGFGATRIFLRTLPKEAHHGALLINEGNASAAARYLGVARPTVMAHMRRRPEIRSAFRPDAPRR